MTPPKQPPKSVPRLDPPPPAGDDEPARGLDAAGKGEPGANSGSSKVKAPARPPKPAPPVELTEGEPCSNDHHDRMYSPMNGRELAENWLCGTCHLTEGWHFRRDTCPPPSEPPPSRVVLWHE